MRNPCLGRGVTFGHASTEKTSCVVALIRAQTEQENVSMNYVGNTISSRKYLKRCLSVWPYQRTAVFNQLPCPPLHSWLHRLKSAAISVLQEDRSRGISSTAHVNTFSDDSLGFCGRMRDGGWTLSPNDKEPGFCFIRLSETREKTISSLVPGSYEESHFL